MEQLIFLDGRKVIFQGALREAMEPPLAEAEFFEE